MTASTTITLDTHAPTLTVQSSGALVDPLGVWEVLLTANEDIGWADLVFLDAAGQSLALGYDLLSTRQVRVTVSPVLLAGGAGHLAGAVADLVGNQAMVSVPVTIDRQVPFEATMTMHPAFEVVTAQDHAFEVEIDCTRAFDVIVTMRGT